MNNTVYVVVDTTAVNCNAKTHPAGWHGMHAIVGVAATQGAAEVMVTDYLANCPWLSHHENGRLMKEENYKDSKKHGPWVEYHENGQLSSKGTYKNGKADGPWFFYHDDGRLYSKGTYKDGKKDGPWVTTAVVVIETHVVE